MNAVLRTILRWYRDLLAKKVRRQRQSAGPGRPRKAAEIVKLAVKMAKDEPALGLHADPRCSQESGIRHRAKHDQRGCSRSRGSIRLRSEGSDARGPPSSRAHLGAIWAADFFTTEVMTLVGLARVHVFFVIDIASRQVDIAGRDDEPCGRMDAPDRTKPVGRGKAGSWRGSATCCWIGIRSTRREFRAALKQGGVQVVRLPPRSPNLNAYAEGFVLSIRSECLDRVVPLGEAHLRLVVREFVEHYHREWNH